MFTDRRLLTGGVISALVVAWVFAMLGMPDGMMDVLKFFAPAALLAIAAAWLFFTFAGSLFTWSRAAGSVIAGAVILAPIIAFFFGTSATQNLTTKFLFIVAVAWAASLGGTLWNLAGATSDAFREWSMSRKMNRHRKLYVPA
jgi:hypothetical protein